MPPKNNRIYNFFHLGVVAGQKPFVQKKIIIANYLSTIFMAIPIFFLVICYLFFPPVAFVFLIGIFVPPLVILLNYFGFNLVARFILGILPTILGVIFMAYLVQGKQELPYGSATSLFTMVAIPFVLFDIREVFYPVLILLLNIMCFIFFPQLDIWFDIAMNVDFFYSNTYNYIALTNAFIILFFCFFVLQKINLNSEKEKQQLITEVEQTNQNLQNKQDRLNQTLKQLRKVQLENHNQTWAIKGINRLNKIIQSYHHSKGLYYQVISEISRYLGALQAGIYMIKEDEKQQEEYLFLEAEYAFNDEKLKNTKFSKSEGLLGQVWQSAELISLDNLPKSHIHWTNNDKIKISSLCLVPIMTDDKVVGVLEFYLGQNLQQYQIQFLENISKNIALNIQNLLHKEKTETMAKQYKRQKEEAESQYKNMLEQVQVLSKMRDKLQNIESENLLKNKLLANTFALININEEHDILKMNTKAQQILEIPESLDNEEYILTEFISHSILTKQVGKMKFGYIWQDAVEIRTALKDKIILSITAGVINEQKNEFLIFLH